MALCQYLEGICTDHSDIAERVATLLGDVLKENQACPKTDTAITNKPSEKDILSRVPNVTATMPRGKFELQFCSTAFYLVNQSHTVCVNYKDVQTIFILDKIPEERKGKVYLLLNLHVGHHVRHGNKELKNIALETKEGVQWNVPSCKRRKDGQPLPNIKGEAAVVLCGLFGQMKVGNFLAPDGVSFRSMSGRTCLGALLKFNKGWLFPLPKALVFIGSPCFVIHHSDILGIELPGAGTERRTFDMRIYDTSGNLLVELSQLETTDLAAWADYMAMTKIKQVTGEADTEDEEGALEQDAKSEDSEADSDFDPVGASGKERPPKRLRPDARGVSIDGSGRAAASDGTKSDDDEVGDGDESGDSEASDDDSDDYGVEMIEEDEELISSLQQGVETPSDKRAGRSGRT